MCDAGIDCNNKNTVHIIIYERSTGEELSNFYSCAKHKKDCWEKDNHWYGTPISAVSFSILPDGTERIRPNTQSNA